MKALLTANECITSPMLTSYSVLQYGLSSGALENVLDLPVPQHCMLEIRIHPRHLPCKCLVHRRNTTCG